MQNELCKCFVHEIIKKVVVITFTGAKINEIHLPLYGGTPCMRVLNIRGNHSSGYDNWF